MVDIESFADNKINVIEKYEISFEKDRKNCNKHFLPLNQCFKGFLYEVFKSSDCVVKG